MPDPAPSTATVRDGGADSLDTGRLSRGLVAAMRVVVAMLWFQNLSWKVPPDFGRSEGGGLYGWAEEGVTHPVLAPYAWLLENVVLPQFTLFGYLTLFAEFAVGVLLLAGLLTRFAALLGIAQTVAITLSVLNAPNEWHWSYFLMLVCHVLLFAVAAGRAHGLDGLFRPRWRTSSSPLARWAVLAS